MDYEKLLRACPNESLEKGTLGVIKALLEDSKKDKFELLIDIYQVMIAFENLIHEQTK